MKMNCVILDSCVAIITKHKSSKRTLNLTFTAMQYLKMQVSVKIEAATGGAL